MKILRRSLILILILAAFTGGYALSQKNAAPAIALQPLAFYNLQADSQRTRLDLVVLQYNGAAIPCVVSMVKALKGVTFEPSGSGVSCAWPADLSGLAPPATPSR